MAPNPTDRRTTSLAEPRTSRNTRRPEEDDSKHSGFFSSSRNYSKEDWGERAGFFLGVTSLSPSSDFEVECSRFLWRP